MIARMLQILDNGETMTTKVEKIAEQVKALPEDEREEFLSWLADFEIEHDDDWDSEIARDSQPGGGLSRILRRVRKDITDGRTKPLDEVLDNS
jgi:hypothetical protein